MYKPAGVSFAGYDEEEEDAAESIDAGNEGEGGERRAKRRCFRVKNKQTSENQNEQSEK